MTGGRRHRLFVAGEGRTLAPGPTPFQSFVGASFAVVCGKGGKMSAKPMSINPYENARRSVEALGPRDQLRLVAELVARLSVSGELNRQPRSLLELEGLGEDVWRGLDVDEYLRRERSSWNG
jgi:hypothetical protein